MLAPMSQGSKECAGCGLHVPPDLTSCPACGAIEFRSVPQVEPSRDVTSALPPEKSFFRLRPASIALLILAILYGLFAMANVLLWRVQSQKGDELLAAIFYWGVVWNLVIMFLCVVARQFMKAQTRTSLIIGALIATSALLIVLRIWLHGMMSTRNPFPWIEPLLIVPPLVYAITYAVRAAKVFSSGGAAERRCPTED